MAASSRKQAVVFLLRGLRLFCREQACGREQGAAGGRYPEALKKGTAMNDAFEFFVEFLRGCEGNFFDSYSRGETLLFHDLRSN
jgi:hypothetical protein